MICVILCGGAGSRLWPESREMHPKPFLRMSDGYSLIQKAFIQCVGFSQSREVMTVTNRDLYLKIQAEFNATGIDWPSSFILEPFGRNTAAAIAAAAATVRDRYGEDETLLIMAADHLIANHPAFMDAVDKALALAAQDRLVTFGILPTAPATGFGYIKADGTRVVEFLEKPNKELAVKFVEQGYLWNSGMFCFKAGTVLAEFAEYEPELLATVESCLDKSRDADKTDSCKTGCVELDTEAFSSIKNISFDYAIMEHSRRIAVVPCDMGWNDVGSWTSLCGMLDADTRGNHVSHPENSVLHEADSCYVYNPERMVAVLGLKDVLVVDTPDALLVADKDSQEDVRLVYEELKRRNHKTYKQHRTVYCPWGSYTTLESGPRFKMKRLIVKPGEMISFQLHHHRNEHWIVVSGMAEVTCEESTFFLASNESTYIKAGSKHRVANRGVLDLVLIDVQTGDYLGEDDIVRFTDIYGRANAPVRR